METRAIMSLCYNFLFFFSFLFSFLHPGDFSLGSLTLFQFPRLSKEPTYLSHIQAMNKHHAIQRRMERKAKLSPLDWKGG